jgi:hypothetical protein
MKRNHVASLLFLLLAFSCLAAASTLYANVSGFAAPTSIRNPLMFGCGIALSPPTGALMAAAGFDAATNGSFLALYRRQGYSGFGYSLQQVLEQQDAIPGLLHAAQYHMLSPACPVQMSSDGKVIVWGWSVAGTSRSNPSTGAVYVAYLDSYTDEYVVTQTIQETAVAYNSSLSTYGVFGAAASLTGDYRILAISAWFYDYLGTLSTYPTSKVYFYALGNNGTAWPPFFEQTSQGNVSNAFCKTCSATVGNYFGFSTGMDSAGNLFSVGAPYDTSSNNDGQSYNYVQKQGLGAASPTGAYFNFNTHGMAPSSKGNYAYSTAVGPDGYNAVFSAPIVMSTVGGSFVTGLANNPTGTFFATSPHLVQDTAVAIGLLQGSSVSLSAGPNVFVLAVATPYGGQNNAQGLITVYEYNTSASTYQTKIQELFPFGTVYESQQVTTAGYSSTVVSWDGATVATGAAGIDDGSVPVLVYPGSVYVWANASGSTPVQTVTPVSCNLGGFIGGMEMYCYATPYNELGFNVSAYLAENPSEDPCRNQTTGVGAIAGYVSWPSGFVTSEGILHGNDGATCGQYQASVAVYVYCNQNASWDCGIPFALNVTRVAAVASTRGSIRPVRNNVFFLYNPEDVPGVLDGGVGTGGIIAIVVAAVVVLAVTALVCRRIQKDASRKFSTV